MQKMENFNIDQVDDVLDTPDRSNFGLWRGVEDKPSSSANGHMNSSDFMGEKLSSEGHCTENGHNWRSVIKPKNIISDEGRVGSRNYIALSPDNYSTSNNGNSSRRGGASDNKRSSEENRHSISIRNMDKGKTIRIKYPFSSSCQDHRPVVDSTAENERSYGSKMGEGSNRRSMKISDVGAVNFIMDSPEKSHKDFKGKEKVDVNITSNGRYKAEKPALVPLNSMASPRVSGQKRLVRNGCFSPQNIALRTKDLDVQCGRRLQFVGQSGLGDHRDRKKGKEVNLCPVSHTNDGGGTISASTSQSRGRVNQPLTNEDRTISITLDGRRKFINQQHPDRTTKQMTVHRNQDTAQSSSRVVPNRDQTSGPCHVESRFNKRQKKNGSSLIGHGESCDSDIVCIGSSRPQSHRIQDILDPIIEVDSLNNDKSTAKVRQIEADEMFARELQQELYHETPFVGSREIDENIVLVQQQEEDALQNASSQSNTAYRPRLSSARRNSNASRQPQTRSVQSTNNRIGSRTRSSISARMMQSRGRFPGVSRTVSSSRQRNIHHIPSDILEALGSMAGNRSRMRMIQRDFNENDYEMLLALDENNHRHSGPSNNRINSLPESTVQTDTFEEACAICLDIPTIGDVIRILPCLHKFHRDCIDPWLNRRTSCPVCKSTIT